MIRKVRFFLGLQIKQVNNFIYIHQMKYIKKILKKFKLDDVKEMKIPMHLTTSFGTKSDSKEIVNIVYKQK